RHATSRIDVGARFLDARDDGVDIANPQDEISRTRILESRLGRPALDVLVLNNFHTHHGSGNLERREERLGTRSVSDFHSLCAREHPWSAVQLQSDHVSVELNGSIEVSHDVAEITDTYYQPGRGGLCRGHGREDEHHCTAHK